MSSKAGIHMAGSGDIQELRKAYVLHQKGSLGDAAKIYRLLIAGNPKNYHALHLLGTIEAATGNIESAKSLMARSMSIQPPNIEFIENYATLLFSSGDYQSSLEMCTKGLRINNK